MKSLVNPSLRMRAALALAVTFAVVAALLSWILSTDLQDRLDAASARLLSEVQLLAAREESILARGDTILNGLSDCQSARKPDPLSASKIDPPFDVEIRA